MLYYAELELSPGKISNVVLLAKVDIEGQETYFDFKSILGNDKVVSFLSTYGDRVLVDALGEEGEKLPFPVVNPSTSPQQMVKATPIYKFYSSTENLDFKAISQKLNNPIFSEQTLKEFKKSFDTVKKYIKREENFKVSVPEMFYSDPGTVRQVVKDYNGKFGHQFQFSNINKTNFMTSEYDQFFIELPDYEKLMTMDLDLRSMVPSPSDIAKPYPHPIYQTPFAGRVFTQSPTQLRQTLREVSSIVKLSPEEMEDVPKINIQHLEGSSSNNDMEIQPNELEFYTALEEYIKYDISQTFPGEDVEEKFKACVCSSRMMQFLRLLLECVARLNWSHTNKIPIGYDDGEDDEDNDSGEISEAAMYLNVDGTITDGLLILEQFLDVASKELGFYAYIEAIIVLARFGEVKPSVLKVGNFNRYLDLNTFYIRNTTGNLSSLKPVLVNGNEFSVEGVILFDDKFRDVKYRNSLGIASPKVTIPVGFVCRKDFSGDVYQTVYMSLSDIVSTYKNNPDVKLIDGISFDGAKFSSDVKFTDDDSVTLRLARESVSSITDKTYIFYASELMKKVTLEFNCPELTSLGILHEFLYSEDGLSKWYEQLKFDSKEELATKIASNPLPVEMYVKTNLANVLISTILKASEKYDSLFAGDYLVSDILNLYLEASNGESAIVSGSSEETEQEDSPKQEPEMKQTEEKLAKMSSFSKTSQADDYLNRLKGHFIHPIEQGDRIIALMDDTNIVGGFVVKTDDAGKKYYIIGDLSIVPEGINPSPNQLKSIETLVFDALWCILSGSPEKSQVKFHSIDTVKYYRSLLNEQLKRSTSKR